MFIFPGLVYYLFNIHDGYEKIIIVAISTILFFLSLSNLFRNRCRYLQLAFYSWNIWVYMDHVQYTIRINVYYNIDDDYRRWLS
ncbi:hypothetical protein EV693_102110 [Nicoletella semolina]|uniref:Uncharacterized protein n=1 Tax=Nicoletella semolina TaxID=271160 RepID=A0A4R2NBB6_9PAST|nr:hypothetical protein EV693_102110 [Nicoletella semolina]